MGRLLFAVGVGVLATLLIAAQSTEFGAKVALLGALVVMCAVRLPGEGLVPAADAAGDRLRAFVGRLTMHDDTGASPARLLAKGAVIGSSVVLVGAAIVAAGAPARVVAEARAATAPQVTVTVDPASPPRVSVDPEVARFSADLAGPGAQGLAVTLAENLAVEASAFRDGDRGVLAAADGGDRLVEMQRRLGAALSNGETTVERYVFDSLRLVPLVSVRDQRSLRMGFEARGSLEEITNDDQGVETGRTTSPFALVFVLSQPTGERWVVVDVRPLT